MYDEDTNPCELVTIHDYEGQDEDKAYWCHTCEQYVSEPCQED